MKADAPLRRLYAFRIDPKVACSGDGEMTVDIKLRRSLETAYTAAKLDSAMPIQLVVDTTSRTSATRDSLLSLAFDKKSSASTTATALATRLAMAMDQRSKSCLLVVTVRGEASASDRQIVLWTFPQDEVFRFGSSNLDVLSDVFSRTSFLRKAAVFVGKQTRTGFLKGRVLDFQMKESNKVAADYWMGLFLEAQPEMSSAEGSRILGGVLRSAYDSAGDDAVRDQLVAVIEAIRLGPQVKWSIDQVIDNLGDVAAEAVRRAAPNPATRSGLFDVDRDNFMDRLRFRAFDLEGGIRVIAPVEAVGQQVVVNDDDGGRQLAVAGRVAAERLRARL